jgi:hypothetical protein
VTPPPGGLTTAPVWNPPPVTPKKKPASAWTKFKNACRTIFFWLGLLLVVAGIGCLVGHYCWGSYKAAPVMLNSNLWTEVEGPIRWTTVTPVLAVDPTFGTTISSQQGVVLPGHTVLLKALPGAPPIKVTLKK